MLNSLITLLEDTEITLLTAFSFSYLQFAAQEEKRQKNERMAQHQKHENQMRDLQLQCEANVRELHQLQVRYRSMKPELVGMGQHKRPVWRKQ